MPATPPARRALRPHSWPLTVKVSLLSAAMIFVVALVTTQVALRWSMQREEAVLARMAAIYLDGVSGAVLPYVQADRPALVQETVGRSLAFHTGLRDRYIEVRWGGADGTAARASVGDDALPRPLSPQWQEEAEENIFDAPDGPPITLKKRVQEEAALMWVFRRFDAGSGRTMEIVAALDLAEIVAERRRAQWLAFLIDVVLAALAAMVGYVFTKSMVRPLGQLTARLQETGAPHEPIPAPELRPASTEFGKLQRGVNSWLMAERHRAEAQARMAEQEKMLLLGKLAAGLAHEVRNPLAGLMNALSTLRRFGHDPQVREETVDLLDRGLNTIARVADAALKTYREPLQVKALGSRDIDDLRVLVAPMVNRRHLRLDWQAEPLPPAELDTGRLRQILLNLLLNACNAAPDGGTVGFRQWADEDTLQFEVRDDGPGLPGGLLRLLNQDKGEGEMPQGPGLGLWVTLRLADDMGARLAVTTSPGAGTRIRVSVPVTPGKGAAAATRTGSVAEGETA